MRVERAEVKRLKISIKTFLLAIASAAEIRTVESAAAAIMSTPLLAEWTGLIGGAPALHALVDGAVSELFH